MPSSSWPVPSPGEPGADPDAPPLYQQLLLSLPTCFPAHEFPTPRSPFLAECLGQACLLPLLPVCPSLFFVSFLLLNVLVYLTWLWVGVSMGVCVCVCEREREHVQDWILGRSHMWHRGIYISWGSQAQMWRSGESGRSPDSLAPPGKDPRPPTSLFLFSYFKMSKAS